MKIAEISQDVFDEFETLTCRLSPENLCCDGLASKACINRELKSIWKEWKAIETRIGQKFSQDEVEVESFRRYDEEREERKARKAQDAQKETA